MTEDISSDVIAIILNILYCITYYINTVNTTVLLLLYNITVLLYYFSIITVYDVLFMDYMVLYMYFHVLYYTILNIIKHYILCNTCL